MYETIVIGGGPVGLYLCKLLEDNNRDYILIEGFKEVGGLCINAYPYKHMHDIPGLGSITGKDFICFLLTFIDRKKIHVNEKYIRHSKKDGIWSITTDKATYSCMNVVLTTGAGLGTYNRPIIDKLDLYENKQIFFFPQDPTDYKNKNVVVFGGGDAALDALETLLTVTNSVTLVHRRNTFSAMKGKLSILDHVKVYTPYNLKSLEGDKDKLDSVTISDNSGVNITLMVDYVFFCYGYNTINSLKYKVDINNMMDESGIFAIGAAGFYDQKRDLISTGMWEARMVLHHLQKSLT